MNCVLHFANALNYVLVLGGFINDCRKVNGKIVALAKNRGFVFAGSEFMGDLQTLGIMDHWA